MPAPRGRLRRRALVLLCAVLTAAAQGSNELAAVPDPDAALREALRELRDGRVGGASRMLADLVRAEPNFRLAQLLYGQTLAMRSGARIGTPLGDDADPQLKELLDELKVRAGEPVPAAADGLLPHLVLQLSDSVRNALLVDLPKSRLYVIRNGEAGPRVVQSYYAAIARNGYGKQATGDLRTPVGVYQVTGWTPGAQLPPLYGAGAFPLNYPNSWDRSLGKSGYGIWLHGVPASTYSRSPRSSEGCVTLSNRDLLALQPVVRVGSTPVILADHVEWRQPGALIADRDALLATIERWRVAWAALDTEAYLAFYAPEFRTGDGQGRSAFADYKRRVNAGKKQVEVGIDDLSLFAYPGESDLVIAQFGQDYRSDNFVSSSRKDQYWRRQADGDWKIVREENR